MRLSKIPLLTFLIICTCTVSYFYSCRKIDYSKTIKEPLTVANAKKWFVENFVKSAENFEIDLTSEVALMLSKANSRTSENEPFGKRPDWD